MSTSKSRYVRPIYCSSYGCLNTSVKNPGLSFFKIPTDPVRRSLWLKLVNREDLISKNTTHHRICDDHFQPGDKTSSFKRIVLKKETLPSRNLPELSDTGQVILSLEDDQLTSNEDKEDDLPLKRKFPSPRRRSKAKTNISVSDSDSDDNNLQSIKNSQSFVNLVSRRLEAYDERLRNEVEHKIIRVLNEADMKMCDATTDFEPTSLAANHEVLFNDQEKPKVMLVNTVEADLAYVKVVKCKYRF